MVDGCFDEVIFDWCDLDGVFGISLFFWCLKIWLDLLGPLVLIFCLNVFGIIWGRCIHIFGDILDVWCDLGRCMQRFAL